MNQRRKVSIIAGACLVFSLAASAVILHRTDELRPQATIEEVLFLSSPKVLKRASLGYDGLLADIYWTRAVQYFGGRHFTTTPAATTFCFRCWRSQLSLIRIS